MKRMDCTAILKALSEMTRMRIMRLLLKDTLNINDIADKLGMSQYNVSRHIRILREAHLVDTEKRGKHRFCTVPSQLRARLASSKNVLRFECCTFYFDKLPK